MEVTIKLDGVGVKELRDLFINILNLTHMEPFYTGCSEDYEFEDREQELEMAVIRAIHYAYKED